MKEQSILHLMENWGYYLLPKPHPQCPGYTGLLVAIRKKPTGKHFDPQSIHLRLCDEHGEAEWARLSLESPSELPIEGSMHVCPGRVVLRDRSDKRVGFFVFGGSLEAVSIPGETVYSLRSLAPVLQITEGLQSIPDQLAFETEELIGEAQGKWGLNDKGFARRLAQVDPFQLYLAVLNSILARYEQDHALQETFHRLHLALHSEKRWLMERGEWLATPPTMEELFAPEGGLGGKTKKEGDQDAID